MPSIKYFALLMTAILSCGCGPQSGTVTGRVLVNGAPMGGFEIRFHSVTDGSAAFGSAGAEGRYQLVQARTMEIATGDYKVTIVPSSEIEGAPLPKVKIPQELASASTTTLVKTVGPGANVIDLEISAQK